MCAGLSSRSGGGGGGGALQDSVAPPPGQRQLVPPDPAARSGPLPGRAPPRPARARGQDLSSHTPDAAAAGPRRGAPFGPPEWPLHFLHPRWRCRFPARALSPRSCASQTPRSPASLPRACPLSKPAALGPSADRLGTSAALSSSSRLPPGASQPPRCLPRSHLGPTGGLRRKTQIAVQSETIGSPQPLPPILLPSLPPEPGQLLCPPLPPLPPLAPQVTLPRASEKTWRPSKQNTSASCCVGSSSPAPRPSWPQRNGGPVPGSAFHMDSKSSLLPRPQSPASNFSLPKSHPFCWSCHFLMYKHTQDLHGFKRNYPRSITRSLSCWHANYVRESATVNHSLSHIPSTIGVSEISLLLTPLSYSA